MLGLMSACASLPWHSKHHTNLEHIMFAGRSFDNRSHTTCCNLLVAGLHANFAVNDCRASSIGRREYPPLTGKSLGFIKSDNISRMQVRF